MSGYNFTYHQEIGHQGQSLIPHFPGGLSGVTLGPGYDMGGRSSIQIYEDLTQAGIEPSVAREFMQAAHLSGNEAAQWVNTHYYLHITEDQQRTLFNHVLVPEYEQRMMHQLTDFAESHPGITSEMIAWENLTDTQKEILFDYTYNPGLSQFPKLTEAVLKQDWQTVEQEYERFSGNESLTYRNETFFHEFLEHPHEIYKHEEYSMKVEEQNVEFERIAATWEKSHHYPEQPQDNHHENSWYDDSTNLSTDSDANSHHGWFS
jgi:hypothetical protein